MVEPRIFGLLKRGDFKIDLGSPHDFPFLGSHRYLCTNQVCISDLY
jgi:hypothetical protein